MVYRLFWFLLVPAIRMYWRLREVGRDNVPRRSGAILACNHVAAIDPILICASFWRQVSWLAKVELVLSKKVAWFFKGAGVIPVNRHDPEDSWMSIAEDVLLRKKDLFGVFPEGTRSPDGRVYRAYTGVSRIAERSGAPVIPTAIVGSDKVHRKGQKLARPGRVQLRYGEPMHFRVREGEEKHDAYQRFADEVLDAVAALKGAERVRDEYSPKSRRAAS